MTGPESAESVDDAKLMPPEPIPARTFSLGSLLLFMVWVAFLLGMTKWDLGAGVAIVILSVPALVRTARIANRLKAKGAVLSFGEKILAFGRSLALVALIATATGGTFLGIGYRLVATNDCGMGAQFVGAVLAIGMSGFIGVALIRLFWLPKE